MLLLLSGVEPQYEATGPSADYHTLGTNQKVSRSASDHSLLRLTRSEAIVDVYIFGINQPDNAVHII